jgi:hypothetical protein
MIRVHPHKVQIEVWRMKVDAQTDFNSSLGKQDNAVSARAFQVPALVILPPNVAKNFRILVEDISIGVRLGIC